ncbi:hypothetical protein B566_EDAN008193 [Ephemera danica]|nr:hypothetical protein B566_EDAN008193 [Ephemera danica]
MLIKSGDLSEFPKLASDADRLLKEVQEFSTDVTDSWTRHVSAALANRSLGLRTDAPVVQFESGKELMRVTYDARLVTLLREARALTVLGHKLPVNIERAVEQAKKFVKQAKALEQVANFHNTIGDRMVLSQRPMMLEAALGLAKLVQQESCVTWADSKAVDAYLVKLQASVERLARNNAVLTSYHNDIRNKVKALMATDLLRNQNLWKQGVHAIRDIFAQVEAQKFGQMRAWRAHWDRQLYKALELQYQVGLESLSEHLPEMKVELVFRQQKLQFQPPMEEIRSKYYAQLRRFLALPNFFRGVQDGNEKPIFPAIVERNARRFGPLFSRAEELFGRLESLKTRFERWVALGSVDLESMVQKLSSAEDWERNFRASKAWGQEIARLTCLEEKLECFTVSFLPVRAEAEVHNRRYWDVLAGSLHSSVLSDVTSVESFAQEGTQVLRLQPHTAEEIGKVSRQHAQLLKTMPDMVARHAEAVKKNNVLAAWTKERVEAVDKIASVWETLHTLLDNHDTILSRQVESIKASLSTRSEELGTQAQKFWLRWQQLNPADSTSGLRDSAALQKIFQALTERKEEWVLLQQTRHQLREEYEQFGLSLPDVLQWEEIEKNLQTQEATWSLFSEFQTGLNEISNEEWIAFRSKSFKFEEFLCKSEQKMREMTESEGVVPLMVCLLREVEQYQGLLIKNNGDRAHTKVLCCVQALLPVLKYIKGDMFSEKHWAEMLDMLSIPNKPVESLLFRDFLDVKENILAQTEQLQELNARAASEIVIRQALNELDVWEVEAKFSLFEHIDSQGKHLFLVQDFKDLLNKVGDNQCLLQSIRGSPNFDRFADQASIWEKRLVTLDECLRHLNQIQRKWLYLEPIFGGGMLAHDKARFARVDADFRHIASDITRDKRVLSLCRRAGLSQSLQNLLDQLGRCQKSLKDFLEEKRSAFPRFYFIGDDDLLEILGQSTKEKVVQAHLKKLFAGIHSVQFDEAGNNIVAMRSLEGEVVPLLSPVKLTQQVEHWLGQLVTEMRRTLQRSLVQCLEQARKSSSGADPLSYPSQILCLTESILFTERCEHAITSSKLQALQTSLKSQLWSYTSQELPQEGDVLELKLRALILDTIYHINIVKKLLDDEKGLSVDSWQWQKCLRFYLKNDGNVVAKMVDAEFSYTYEYLGNAPKLVHTPLTDKCYLTVTQAMHLGLGGNPLGPAGTGKTESGIDVKSMTRIFVGLAKCGAWGCFDEFNRLEEATLSAISMQIQPIQAALKAKQPSVNIMGEEISLDPNSGIFVTMNPAGKGYGGRQKLPDNLKQLFRPVVMCQPDSEQIAEVLLHMEGFRTAADLGTRLVEVFTLAKRLLSSQQHYDWGLRALKTVLQGCGAALRAARGSKPANPVDEAQLAVQVLRLNIFSKLTAADCSRLDALLRDVFPKVSLLDSSDQQLEAALKNSCLQLQFEENSKQIHKCIEVYKQLQQRMGVVLMGPTGSGKSTVLNLLKHALRGLGHNVRRHTISPKSMPRAQLLGYVDPDTRQWQDGVLTVIAQQVHSEPQDVFSWVVCDGDVDPEWVESLNSVLDDNRLLTLPSGWRIQFGPNVNFLFETHDLSQASPATISRMGIVLLSDNYNIITFFFCAALDWVLQQGEAVVPCSPVGLVRSGLSQFHDVSSTSHFTCALLRGLGSHLTANSRETFATQVLHICQLPFSSIASQNCARPRWQRFIAVRKLPRNSSYKNLVSYPDRGDLRSIYGSLLHTTLAPVMPQFGQWHSSGKLMSIVDTMISLYSEVLVHEAQSLFQDMLCTEEERAKFVDMLSTTIEDKWNRSASALFAKLSDVFYVSVATTSKKNAMFPYGQPLGQLYKEDWTTIVERVMAQTGREQQSPSLLLIPELLRGMARVERVLTAPYGNILLAGQVGAGRKSAVQLVSVLHGTRLVTPNMASGYNAMQMAGLESQQIFLLIEAHQIVEPSFLDIINSLLAAGEVPGLYAAEELEPLVSSLREIAAQEGFIGGPIAYFAEKFVRNCNNYPSLYKHCVIQWWDSWDDESMLQIPQKFLQKDAEGDESLVEDESIYEHLLTIHKQAPSKQLHTPRRYVAFVHLYRSILATKHRNIRERQSKLKAGVSKLTEARQVVAELRSQAEIQEKQLAEKQQEAATALHLISDTMQGANTQKLEMEGLKEQTMKENEQLLKRKKAIDLELAEIEPLIKEAQAAVGNIKAEALSEIRSLRAPPDVIRDILEGVLRLMGIQDTSWNSMKTFLAKRGVKEDIRAFNARTINVENRVTVEKLLREKADSFDPKNAKRASVAAAPLAAWVNANVKYSIVLEKIRPLEREQNKLHKNLQSAEDNIGKLSSELSDVGDRVAKLKERLNTYTKEAAEIEIHLKQAKDTLLAAENLVGKLNEEYERWKSQLQELTDDLSVLPLHALLAAAFVTYLSGLAEEHRRTLLQDWQSHLGLEYFSMRRFLASERELLLWQGEGLPSDQLSVENAITILQTALRPLLVDPSSQAVEWLKRHMKNRALEVSQMAMIIGTRCVVNIGGKMVDYHKDFELYLVSRSAKPDVAPGAAAVLTMVDFSTTQAGLSGQLLGCALRHDKPELEARRGELLAEEEKSRARLDQLQEKLLLKLSSAQGDVLQNKELLASLNETKASSAAISASLKESSKLQSALEVEREAYRPLAHFGSLLYFATLDLAHVNSTYHFSVSSFLRLFQQALDQLELEEDTEARIAAVKRCLLRLLYNNVGRALFKKDRLMFAMHLVHKINPQLIPENLEKEDVWSEFLQSGEAELHLPAHLDAFSSFQRVLVVQALRSDRLHTMMQLFAQKALGLHDLSPSTLSLKKYYTGLLFQVALGQGQLEMAEQLLRDAVSNGHWLCLKNLHLVCKWLPELESLLGSLQPHENFRLWLTSQPHPALSPVLMQSCLKITYEAPQGIKRNLQRTYAAWGRETVENNGRIKWDYIYGLYETAIYGGRVDNEFDLRVLSIYVRNYFNSDILSGSKFGPGIVLPSSAKFTDSLNVINQLPDQDKPEYFGLPANIDRSWQRLTSASVIRQLLLLSSPLDRSTKHDYTKWESQLSPILNLWKKLNQSGGLVQSKLPPETSKPEDTPLQQFCASEWRSAVHLIHTVHRSLASLLRVMRGAALPNSEMVELAEAIITHQVT